MKGGPSHVDSFDYKPQLQRDDGKEFPFAKPTGAIRYNDNVDEITVEVLAAG